MNILVIAAIGWEIVIVGTVIVMIARLAGRGKGVLQVLALRWPVLSLLFRSRKLENCTGPRGGTSVSGRWR